MSAKELDPLEVLSRVLDRRHLRGCLRLHVRDVVDSGIRLEIAGGDVAFVQRLAGGHCGHQVIICVGNGSHHAVCRLCANSADHVMTQPFFTAVRLRET